MPPPGVAARNMATLGRRGGAQTMELKADTLVGRSRRCDLVLEHDSVSQVHASIRFIAGVWQIEDRNSKNGTWVGGESLSQRELHPLGRGSTIRFGAKGFEEWELLDEAPPADVLPGLTTTPIERSLRQAQLLIHSNLNLELTFGITTLSLKGRVPYLVLQELARERLRDRERTAPADEEGWLDRRLLSERLRNRDVNQDIHRIRQDFQRLQLFDDAAEIVEDHREQGKVRLGIFRVQVA
jgi:pSer/pThr/pTyr-binding forkhead associated (FHA) protein